MRAVSALAVVAGLLMVMASGYLLGHHIQDESILVIIVHIYAILFGIMAVFTEVSLFSAQSRFGPRLLESIPFLRTRYGRALFYMTSGLIIFFICINESNAIKLAALLVGLSGLLYGAIGNQG